MLTVADQNLYTWLIVGAIQIGWTVFMYTWFGPWLRNEQNMDETTSRIIELSATALVGWLLV